MAAKIDLTFPKLYSITDTLSTLIHRVKVHDHIQLFLNTEVKEISGFVGNFIGNLKTKNKKEKKFEFGNIVLATGLRPVDPKAMTNTELIRNRPEEYSHRSLCWQQE